MDANPDYKASNTNEYDKKIIRRDIERKRRQEMASLWDSLRSHLPLESIKGKRSTADHIDAAVNYVKYLQNNMKELSVKRDVLKTLSNPTMGGSSRSGNPSQCATSCEIEVYTCLRGVKIVFSNGSDEERVRLSRVVSLLLEERLDVVSCASTKINEKLVHTIHSEVRDMANFSLSELLQKLNNL